MQLFWRNPVVISSRVRLSGTTVFLPNLTQDGPEEDLYGIFINPPEFLENIRGLCEGGELLDIILARHEIVGMMMEVGSKVEKFKVGDKVGVKCLVGSCGSCDSCRDNFDGFSYFDGTKTYGKVF